jgi:hypothetical protein
MIGIILREAELPELAIVPAPAPLSLKCGVLHEISSV